MATIKWADPPPTNPGRHPGDEFAEFVKELKAHRGKWAILPTGDRNARQCQYLASNIVRGRHSLFRDGVYSVRRVQDVVYIRYDGRRRG